MKKAIINTDYDEKTMMELILKQSSLLHYSVSVNVSLSPFLIASSAFYWVAGFIVIWDALRNLVLFLQF